MALQIPTFYLVNGLGVYAPAGPAWIESVSGAGHCAFCRFQSCLPESPVSRGTAGRYSGPRFLGFSARSFFEEQSNAPIHRRRYRNRSGPRRAASTKNGRKLIMITHGKSIKIFTGNSNPNLAKAICQELGVPLGNSEVGSFADGENFASIYETVRGSDVFVVQSTCPFEKDGKMHTVNDALMELLIMIDALRRASAGRITAVIPYFGYARQDRKTKPRDPISAKLVANLITRAGADRVLTMDLHANQIQGFFDIPVDNLLGSPLFVSECFRKFAAVQDETMVVSPDVGSVARARAFAQKLNMPLAIVDKRRQKANSSEVMNIIGDVKGKHVILLDDMVDTGGSLCHAAKALVDIGGAKDVTACATHGLLSGPAVKRISESVMDEVVFLDTIPPKPGMTCDKIRYISVAHMFAEAISHIYEETSVSRLFT